MYEWFLWCLVMFVWTVIVVVVVKSGKKGKKRTQHSDCLWNFRDTECNYKGPETDCNKTLKSCRDKFDNSKHFGGFPGLVHRDIEFNRSQFLCTGELNSRRVGITEISRPAVGEPFSTSAEPLVIKKYRPGDDVYVQGIFLDEDTVFYKQFTIQEWHSFQKTCRRCVCIF